MQLHAHVSIEHLQRSQLHVFAHESLHAKPNRLNFQCRMKATCTKKKVDCLPKANASVVAQPEICHPGSPVNF